MTLLDRLTEVAGLAQAANELDRAQTRAGIVHERANQLQGEAEKLQEIRARARVLRETNVALSLPPPPPLLALDEYRNATTDDPAKGNAEFKKLIRALERTLKTSTNAVNKAIETARRPIVEQKKGAGALESLAKIDGYEERVGQVLQALGNLASQDWKKKDADELREVLELRSHVLEQIDQLETEDVSQNVRDFFKAAREEGATLEQWTDEVRSYLRERGLLDGIRIVLR